MKWLLPIQFVINTTAEEVCCGKIFLGERSERVVEGGREGGEERKVLDYLGVKLKVLPSSDDWIGYQNVPGIAWFDSPLYPPGGRMRRR